MDLWGLHHQVGSIVSAAQTIMVAMSCVLFVACGVSEENGLQTKHGEFEGAEAALRPTEPDPYIGIGYGDASTEFYDSEGGRFRVWWATTGPHTPPLIDVAPANGVPDYVDEVAQTADEVEAYSQSQGFRTPLDDTSLGDGPDGGDDRVDIYLVDFDRSADGLVARNMCVEQGPVATCTAHLLIENDFAGYGYPSVSQAIDVLVSHEYFHVLQLAYTSELPSWVSEGSATWFEEAFHPEQSDFERLANGFFEESSRSLDSNSQGPFDGFNYAAGLFFHFLDLKLDGPQVVVDVLEAMAQGKEALEALDEVLKAKHDTSFQEVFIGFAATNAFTGSRAVQGQGYPAAQAFSKVDVEVFDVGRGINWTARVKGVAARYALAQVDGPVRVTLKPADGFDAQPRLFVLFGPDDVREAPLDIAEPPATGLVLAMINPDASETTAGVAALRAITIEPEPQPEPKPDPQPIPAPTTSNDDGGCATSGGSAPLGWTWMVLGACVLWRRRRVL